MSGIVAIVGRPNVGKSTLFNRLIESRQAIVDDLSGVTRDRNYGRVHWTGHEFSVVDTGGYVQGSEDVFEKAIREQVHIAMEEADALLFVVDALSGLTPLDLEFAHVIRKSKKPVLVVANKVDNAMQRDSVYDFYEMGLEEIFPVSAANGSGTGDLLDRLVEVLPRSEAEEEVPDVPRFAVVGRPNAGKSSLVNALLGREANIVTPIAGTTRDSVDTRYRAFGHDLMLIDTAGLRRKARVKENLEFYSNLRSIRAIEECDVAILLLDATRGLEAQDLAIVQLIQKNLKGMVIAFNKWDLVDKETDTARDIEKALRERLGPFSDVPIIFSSVLEKQRILKVLDEALKVFENRHRKISTHKLNEVMLAAIARHHPPTHRGRIIRIKYVTQLGKAKVPTFLFFTNHPQHVQESYKRYLENQLRANFNFTGTPVNLFFRKK
jgi:GTP-binding protein